MYCVWGRGDCTGFWWENLRERDHCGDHGVDGRIIIRRIFRKWDMRVWTGLGWFKIRHRLRVLVNKEFNIRVP
jgi:hypothetical protein